MPKKVSIRLCLSLLLVFGLLLAASPTHAITLKLNNGAVEFYQDSVLGENTDLDGSETATEPVPDKVIAAPTKEHNEVKLQPVSKDRTALEIQQKNAANQAKTVQKKQEMERVKLEFQDKEAKLRDARKQAELELMAEKKRLEESNDPNKEMLLRKKKEELNARLEKQKLELKQSLSPRPQNSTETKEELKEKLPLPADGTKPLKPQVENPQAILKLQDAIRDNKRELQLQGAGGATSRFTQGAEVSVDAETGTVTITTPSGQTKTLNNLPDEVLEKIKNQGNFTPPSNNEIETFIDQNGQVKHSIKNVQREKRLFGFFPRQVQGDAIVDDVTGEVQFSQTEQTPITNVLDALSI